MLQKIRCQIPLVILLIFNYVLTSHGFFREKRDYIIQSKSICIADLVNQFERVTCQMPRAKFDVVNAGLYNSTSYINGTLLARCLPIDKYTPLIKTVTNALRRECSQYSCLIVHKTIDSLISDASIDVRDLVLDINYSCRNFGDGSINSHPAAYSFTYFFYIITLILSTSCILVGGVFILRKFLVLRRRNNIIARRARANQGYVPNSNSENMINSSSSGGIWTTAYPPPSYDNIYENSLPVNPLPDYDSTLNNQIKDEKKDEPIDAESPEPYNSVMFANRDEIVTIVNPAFSSDAVVADSINDNDSISDAVVSSDSRESTSSVETGISIENLHVEVKDSQSKPMEQHEPDQNKMEEMAKNQKF